MKKATLILAVTVVLCGAGLAFCADVTPASDRVETVPLVEVRPTPDKPLVQMAILLDTSGSMSGLIDQARTELWSIVNEFIFARRNGVQPEVWVALYEYGKSSLSEEVGYVRRIVPLTTDLDKISEELFALKTNGGAEYCGWVIRDATKELQWSDSPDDLKVIFIAGNEPFTQGPVDYRQACKTAVANGIIVNTIHCGPEGTGIDGKWKDGAVLADGRFLNINQNHQVVQIAAPQDKELAELSVRLNTTYVAFGKDGRMLLERQAAQDENAAQISLYAMTSRARTKASSNYRNSHWDLVDAVELKEIDLSQVDAEQLPENMRDMDGEQRLAYVQTKANERADLQQRIRLLNAERDRFIAVEMTKLQGQDRTLGSAVVLAIREQARKKNFRFVEPEPKPQETKPSASK